MEDIDTYVNRLFINLGFGELGVNIFNDQYTFEVGGALFYFEPLVVQGGGDNLFPNYESGALVVTVIVREFENIDSIPSKEMLSWLAMPPMFGSLFLQADEDGKPQLRLKQETALSGDLDSDVIALLFVLDNLYGQFQERS